MTFLSLFSLSLGLWDISSMVTDTETKLLISLDVLLKIVIVFNASFAFTRWVVVRNI